MPSKQAPLHSGYGAQTSAREALGGRDSTGAFALVTGGQAGIGLETSRALVEAGATVTVGARAGVYCEDADIATPVAAAAQLGGGRPWATDPEAAERLWGLSEGWTGVGIGG